MKKVGKVFVAWILTGILLLSFTACGAQNHATKAFDAMMQALKSGEKEQVQVYFDIDGEMAKFLTERKTELEDAVLDALKKMDYKVEAIQKIDNNQVSIEAKITTLDFSEVMNRFLNQVMLLVSGEEYRNQVGNMSKETYQNLLIEQMVAVLAQTDIEKIESIVSVVMIKENGKWQMEQGGETFLDTIFVGLFQTINSLV